MDDVEEIKKLKARYFRAMDSQDWELFRDQFTEDLVVDITALDAGVHHGRDVFVGFVAGLGFVQTVHHGHMPEIDVTGPTTATGVWALEDFNVLPDGSQFHGWGHYLETYEKADGRWRIKTLKLSYLRLERGENLRQPDYLAGPAGALAHLRGPNPAAR